MNSNFGPKLQNLSDYGFGEIEILNKKSTIHAFLD